MRLNEKIKTMIQEVGYIPMICEQTTCKEKMYFDIKHLHCPDTFPYVKMIDSRPFVYDLCIKKIDDYFKK